MDSTHTKQTGIKVKLTGIDGNIFVLIGIVNRALKKAHADRAREMTNRVMASESYYAALNIMREYVIIL